MKNKSITFSLIILFVASILVVGGEVFSQEPFEYEIWYEVSDETSALGYLIKPRKIKLDKKISYQELIDKTLYKYKELYKFKLHIVRDNTAYISVLYGETYLVGSGEYQGWLSQGLVLLTLNAFDSKIQKIHLMVNSGEHMEVRTRDLFDFWLMFDNKKKMELGASLKEIISNTHLECYNVDYIAQYGRFYAELEIMTPNQIMDLIFNINKEEHDFCTLDKKSMLTYISRYKE